MLLSLNFHIFLIFTAKLSFLKSILLAHSREVLILMLTGFSAGCLLSLIIKSSTLALITFVSSLLILLLHKIYEPNHHTVIIQGDMHGDVIIKGDGSVQTKSTNQNTQVIRDKRYSVSHMRTAVKCAEQDQELYVQDGNANKVCLEDVVASISSHQETSEKPSPSEDGNQDDRNDEMDANTGYEHSIINHTENFAMKGKELAVAEHHRVTEQDTLDMKFAPEEDGLPHQPGNIHTNSDNVLLQQADTTRSALCDVISTNITKKKSPESKLDYPVESVQCIDTDAKQSLKTNQIRLNVEMTLNTQSFTQKIQYNQSSILQFLN